MQYIQSEELVKRQDNNHRHIYITSYHSSIGATTAAAAADVIESVRVSDRASVYCSLANSPRKALLRAFLSSLASGSLVTKNSMVLQQAVTASVMMPMMG